MKGFGSPDLLSPRRAQVTLATATQLYVRIVGRVAKPRAVTLFEAAQARGSLRAMGLKPTLRSRLSLGFWDCGKPVISTFETPGEEAAGERFFLVWNS